MNTLTQRAPPKDDVSIVMKQLLQHTKMSGNALARDLNFPPPTITRLVTGGVKDPRASTLIAIADYFNITVDQLLGREHLPKTFTLSDNKETTPKPHLSIPVLNTSQVIHYQEYLNNPTEWLRWQSNHESLDNKYAFAMQLKNDLYQPVFNKGTLVIIDPKVTPESDDYVLVAFTGDANGIIKRYVAEGRHKSLHALNPDLKTIPFETDDCSIIGVIIETYTRFK